MLNPPEFVALELSHDPQMLEPRKRAQLVKHKWVVHKHLALIPSSLVLGSLPRPLHLHKHGTQGIKLCPCEFNGLVSAEFSGECLFVSSVLVQQSDRFECACDGGRVDDVWFECCDGECQLLAIFGRHETLVEPLDAPKEVFEVDEPLVNVHLVLVPCQVLVRKMVLEVDVANSLPCDGSALPADPRRFPFALPNVPSAVLALLGFSSCGWTLLLRLWCV